MDYREIEAFLAVASCHSISGAADLLNVTQSAVSHRIRKLLNYDNKLLGSIAGEMFRNGENAFGQYLF